MRLKGKIEGGANNTAIQYFTSGLNRLRLPLLCPERACDFATLVCVLHFSLAHLEAENWKSVEKQ